MARALVNVTLGAPAEGVPEVPPVERHDVHAGFLANARALGQFALAMRGRPRGVLRSPHHGRPSLGDEVTSRIFEAMAFASTLLAGGARCTHVNRRSRSGSSTAMPSTSGTPLAAP